MTQTVYLFDPHGVDAKCLISNESRAVPALGGRFRCIIPSAAPFYRKGAVVKVGARVLKEGIDFYFGHQYIRGTHQTAQMIYGSILILDATVTTPVTLSYQTLGGQYTVTDARIAQYLANELTDPIAASWESVMGNDLYFPPVDIAYDIDNWSGENELKAELSRIADAIRNQEPLESEEYDLYDRWILEQQAIIDDSLWAEHLANHDTTPSSGGTVTPPADDPVSFTLYDLVKKPVSGLNGFKGDLPRQYAAKVGYYTYPYNYDFNTWRFDETKNVAYKTCDFNVISNVIYNDNLNLSSVPNGLMSSYIFTNYVASYRITAGTHNRFSGMDPAMSLYSQSGTIGVVLAQANMPNVETGNRYNTLTSLITHYAYQTAARFGIQGNPGQNTWGDFDIYEANQNLVNQDAFIIDVVLTDRLENGAYVPDAMTVTIRAERLGVKTVIYTYTLSCADFPEYFADGCRVGIMEQSLIAGSVEVLSFTSKAHAVSTANLVTLIKTDSTYWTDQNGTFSPPSTVDEFVQLRLPYSAWTSGPDITKSPTGPWLDEYGGWDYVTDQAAMPSYTLRSADHFQGPSIPNISGNFYVRALISVGDNSWYYDLNQSNTADDVLAVFFGMMYDATTPMSGIANPTMSRMYGLMVGDNLPSSSKLMRYNQEVQNGTSVVQYTDLTSVYGFTNESLHTQDNTAYVEITKTVDPADSTKATLAFNFFYTDNANVNASWTVEIPNYTTMRLVMGQRHCDFLSFEIEALEFLGNAKNGANVVDYKLARSVNYDLDKYRLKYGNDTRRYGWVFDPAIPTTDSYYVNWGIGTYNNDLTHWTHKEHPLNGLTGVYLNSGTVSGGKLPTSMTDGAGYTKTSSGIFLRVPGMEYYTLVLEVGAGKWGYDPVNGATPVTYPAGETGGCLVFVVAHHIETLYDPVTGHILNHREHQLSFVVDPMNRLGGGAITMWVDFNTDHAVEVTSSDVYNYPVTFDDMNTADVTIEYNPYHVYFSFHGGGFHQEWLVSRGRFSELFPYEGVLQVGFGAWHQPYAYFNVKSLRVNNWKANYSSIALDTTSVVIPVGEVGALSITSITAGELFKQTALYGYGFGIGMPVPFAYHTDNNYRINNTDYDKWTIGVTEYNEGEPNIIYYPVQYSVGSNYCEFYPDLDNPTYNGWLSGYLFSNYTARYIIRGTNKAETAQMAGVPPTDGVGYGDGNFGVVIAAFDQTNTDLAPTTYSLVFNQTKDTDGYDINMVSVWKDYGTISQSRISTEVSVPDFVNNAAGLTIDITVTEKPSGANYVPDTYTVKVSQRVEGYTIALFTYSGNFNQTNSLRVGVGQLSASWEEIELVSFNAVNHEVTVTPTEPTTSTSGTNPHNTQWYEAGALKSDGVAQNADKLSNLTKDQLADYVNARQGVATTGLFPLTGNRILTGDLVLQDGLANLSRYAQDTGENESFLQLSTGNITLNGDRNVTIQADKDKNNPGTAATMEAGVNVLKVVSSGGALEKDKLLFNNQQVLTTETLKDHLPTDANATVNISYANGGGLTFSGKGSSVDPLKVNVSLPDGSLTKVGLMQLTSALDNSAPGTAATPYAIKKLNDQLADLVPTTRKINGYPLSANVRITTTNLGLDHVDNTTDAAKPVNGNHRALLNQYNVIVHEHTASDFSMNIATTAVAGLVIYSDVVSSDTTHALMSTAVSMLDTTADENDRYLYTKVPVTATDIVRYGDAGYLPIPVVGSYPAAGVNASSLSTVGEIEADGTLVCLRNGSDVSESGVYYTYATFNADGSIKKVTPTTTKYTPDYLPANDSMLWVTRGTEGVFVIRSLLGKHYIVLTNGTMESRYHVGSEITTSLTHGWQLMPIIVGQYVYLINHNYANTEYAFSAWRCLRSDIGKGPVAFTQLTFTGTDAFGNVQTAVTRFNLVPGGISTDPTAKIQAIDLSGGVWTTRNLRYANCNYDMAAEGNKVRVATYVSMYLANSSRSVWSHYSTGYVIDFDTMTATLDTPDGFPIKFDANGAITTSLRQGNESIGFPRASANNQTGVIRSRGKTIAYMFYGSEYIPVLGAFKYTVGASEFDQLNTNTSQSVAIGSALYFNGNYGSVLGANQRGLHLISGNRYVAYQADGTYVQAEYDLNSTYVVGDLGYGPTVNRKTITPAQHLAYTRTIHTVDAAGVAVNDGYVFSDNALSGPSKIIGETLTNTVSITATAFNALKANFFAQLGVGTPDATTRFINAKLSVYVATSPDYPTVAFYSYRVYSDDTLTASVVKYIIATVTLDSRSAITSAVLNAVIKSGTSSPSITFLNDPSQAYGGSTFAKLADGNVLLILQSHSNYGTVGGSALNAALLIYNPTTSTWIRSDTFGTAQYVATGYFYTKEQGIFSAWRHATGEAVMINRRGSTSAAFATGSSTTAIFTATRVATGWLIYFTEPVVYFCDGVKYTLPVQNLDVRTFFPGEYQNQTMYLYVTLIAGVPTYTMSLTHVEDTPTATYIGYCTTDSNKVTALSVERATRLGLFRELQAHLNDSDAHGTGSATLASIGLPLLENKAPHYELKTDLFGEVYNSWTRFSHWPTDYNTAAYPGEVNAWTFDASADTVRCTQNTVGYSGFVSLDAVGDFTFDTVVGVKPTSTDGDNDAITLVIAFKTEDGKQHDISVVRSRSIDAHIKVDTMFGVYYDYMGPEQTKIASVLTTTSESPGMWRGYYARIRVVRVGDNYTVLSTPVSNTVDWSAAIDSDFIFAINFTLNDLPALAKFKGPTRYGYGAVSQIDASYINYLRPDEDGRNYYATAIEAIKAADWQSRMSVTSGTVTNGGILPVPAGYDATECRWFLSPRLVNGTPPAGKGMMSYTMSYNASRVVTATSTYEDGTVVPNIVHYQCLAVKGIKLFK